MINIFLPDSKGNGIKPGTVHVTDGWTVGVSEDGRTARRQEAARTRIGSDMRDDAGRILWGKVTDPKLKALRSATEKPAPRTLRIPAGLIDEHGELNEERLGALPPAQQQRLRDLARANFS